MLCGGVLFNKTAKSLKMIDEIKQRRKLNLANYEFIQLWQERYLAQ